MTIVVAILGLIFLIFIHEMGHMLVAKAFGVRVPEFAIGFGPPLVQKKLGKTTYSFRLILLGGFAKIAGMGDSEVPSDRRDSRFEEARSRKAGSQEAHSGSMTWLEGEEDFVPPEPERDGGDAEPAPDTYYAKAGWKRALIIFAGPGVNLLFALLLFSGLQAIQGVPTQIEPEVSQVQAGTMAEEVGLEKQDRVVALDGQSFQNWEGFNEALSSRSAGEEVSLTYVRAGERNTVTGELGAVSKASDEALVGIRPTATEVSHSPFVALWQGTQMTGDFIVTYLNGLYQLATGQLDFFNNINGPVGITAVGSEVISIGTLNALTFLGIISIVLGIMNLLPVLPLDGGHLLFIAAEKLRGKPITEETMNKVATVGLMLFVTLFLFATYADISKIITGQPFIPQ
ncbi:M50 family metallopeptidase [Rubrobacter aplysinae]|uniref:M50 family metallopeptidase n=1 Tax=Rubrobacter aplysinae TaxID=909625 RepID=UPI00064BEC60|nr:M50 family metallopeptidase [Rubrobacter aplysinae]